MSDDLSDNDVPLSQELNAKVEEPWFNWKVVVAFVYIMICVFDFLIMVVYVQIETHESKVMMRQMIKDGVSDELVIKLMDTTDRNWYPVTLAGGGLFHLAFGGILSGIGITKGLERREAIKNAK